MCESRRTSGNDRWWHSVCKGYHIILLIISSLLDKWYIFCWNECTRWLKCRWDITRTDTVCVTSLLNNDVICWFQWINDTRRLWCERVGYRRSTKTDDIIVVMFQSSKLHEKLKITSFYMWWEIWMKLWQLSKWLIDLGERDSFTRWDDGWNRIIRRVAEVNEWEWDNRIFARSCDARVGGVAIPRLCIHVHCELVNGRRVVVLLTSSREFDSLVVSTTDTNEFPVICPRAIAIFIINLHTIIYRRMSSSLSVGRCH